MFLPSLAAHFKYIWEKLLFCISREKNINLWKPIYNIWDIKNISNWNWDEFWDVDGTKQTNKWHRKWNEMLNDIEKMAVSAVNGSFESLGMKDEFFGVFWRFFRFLY